MRDTRGWEHNRRFEDDLIHEMWIAHTLRPGLRKIGRTLLYTVLVVLAVWLTAAVLGVAADRTERLPGQGSLGPEAIAVQAGR